MIDPDNSYQGFGSDSCPEIEFALQSSLAQFKRVFNPGQRSMHPLFNYFMVETVNYIRLVGESGNTPYKLLKTVNSGLLGVTFYKLFPQR